MRVAQPSTGAFTQSNVAITDGVTYYSGGTWVFGTNENSVYAAAIKYQHSASTLTQWRPYQIVANNNSAAYMEFSAEL
jgi:hypothetical protein